MIGVGQPLSTMFVIQLFVSSVWPGSIDRDFIHIHVYCPGIESLRPYIEIPCQDIEISTL